MNSYKLGITAILSSVTARSYTFVTAILLQKCLGGLASWLANYCFFFIYKNSFF